MAKIDDGGPAFPGQVMHCREDGTLVGENLPGLSIRDYFAAKALHALLTSPDDCWPRGADGGSPLPELALAWARMAYTYADAMITARKDGSE